MTEWTIDTLKEHFETILAERDTALKAALAASETAIAKAETRLNEILEGFPQEYGRKTELELIETEINTIRSDHVQRSEFSELKDAQSQGRGARLAASAALGIIIALITVALGAMYANQLTNHEVSQQIDREAPWLQDKPLIEQRLNKLETKVILLQTSLTTHEATDALRFKLKTLK